MAKPPIGKSPSRWVSVTRVEFTSPLAADHGSHTGAAHVEHFDQRGTSVTQYLVECLVKSSHLVNVHLVCGGERRKFGAVQDFIRPGIADPRPGRR